MPTIAVYLDNVTYEELLGEMDRTGKGISTIIQEALKKNLKKGEQNEKVGFVGVIRFGNPNGLGRLRLLCG